MLTDGRTASELAPQNWREQVPTWLAAMGFVPVQLVDLPGLAVARTLSMLVNESADAVAQGGSSAQDVDTAMKLGVNYPRGPFEWLTQWNAASVVTTLDALDAHYRGDR